MPATRYSVLKGTPVSGSISPDSRPHYLLELNAAGARWQVAVNVESDTGLGANAQVLYALQGNWTPPDAAALRALPPGITELAGVDADPAIDYLRSRADGQSLVTRDSMTKLPLPGPDASENAENPVIRFLDEYLASSAGSGTVYAFGSQYTSGNGIHDIHMNQGNPAADHGADNGIWQDGLLVLSTEQAPWAALFIAFQDQVWSTDQHGNPLEPGSTTPQELLKDS